MQPLYYKDIKKPFKTGHFKKHCSINTKTSVRPVTGGRGGEGGKGNTEVIFCCFPHGLGSPPRAGLFESRLALTQTNPELA